MRTKMVRFSLGMAAGVISGMAMSEIAIEGLPALVAAFILVSIWPLVFAALILFRPCSGLGFTCGFLVALLRMFGPLVAGISSVMTGLAWLAGRGAKHLLAKRK